jgi:hypothetical protein
LKSMENSSLSAAGDTAKLRTARSALQWPSAEQLQEGGQRGALISARRRAGSPGRGCRHDQKAGARRPNSKPAAPRRALLWPKDRAATAHSGPGPRRKVEDGHALIVPGGPRHNLNGRRRALVLCTPYAPRASRRQLTRCAALSLRDLQHARRDR